ncbi:MAG TPA: DUF3152 domain-containing protein [Candidatus Limnocylindrales bacterium]|nr:DUF3152 domain-containing protein [Candidatus Limnocylindrales bacterium]
MRLRWAATIVLTACALGAAAIWAPEGMAWRSEQARTLEVEVEAPAPVEPTRDATTKPTREATTEPTRETALAEPGDVPASGPGSFVGALEGGPLLGATGQLKQVRVAVEANLTAELDGLTAAVDAVLGDPRSWAAGGYRFQRVPYYAPHDFTIYLVTRETAYSMCRVNGVDIRVDGVPYTSCRQVGQVIINLDRWRLSVPPYVDNDIPLKLYRAYVINHEVGHELGRGHVGCPAPGRPAPVMLPQTLGLQGCAPNSWPYPDGGN